MNPSAAARPNVERLRGATSASVVPVAAASAHPERDWAAEADRLAQATDWTAALPARASGIRWRMGQFAKRAVDVVASAVGLLVLSPVFLLAAIAIKLDSGGPVFYPWCVVGYRGRRFVGYKLRTMVRDADRLKAELLHLNHMTGPVFKMKRDPRVTRVGQVLRRTSLDELPQLWSVLVGHMSLVGPRPMFPHEFVQCSAAQRQKLSVVPGITCTWQISGRSEITDFEEWLALDLEYIRDWSFTGDLRLLLRTIPAVINGRGAH